jgi:hypothetical protein
MNMGGVGRHVGRPDRALLKLLHEVRVIHANFAVQNEAVWREEEVGRVPVSVPYSSAYAAASA